MNYELFVIGGYVVMGLVAVLFLFLLLRKIILWYFKIDDMEARLSEIERVIKNIANIMELKNKALLAEHPEVTLAPPPAPKR